MATTDPGSASSSTAVTGGGATTGPLVLPAKTRIAAAVSAALLASAAPLATHAQGLEEVIVTATKRQESVQDVPLAISAFSGDFTRDVNLDDVKDLVALTPGVTGNSKDSFIDVISVRGIRTNDFGVGGDPSAGFFKNNLYEGRNGAVVTSLYDMERSEVLRGPQGFLFGRNAIGGAFSVYTRRPDLDNRNGYFEVDLGERNHIVAEGGFNVQASDNMAFRLAGYSSDEDGYVSNASAPGSDDLIAHDKWAVRVSGLYEQGDLTVNATLEYEERQQSGTVYRATQLGPTWDTLVDLTGVSLTPNDIDFNSDLPLGSADNSDILTIGLEIEYRMDSGTFTSITGFKDHEFLYAEDFDGTDLAINGYRQDQSGDYLQQEFRFTSDSDGPLSWYAGVSFYKEEIDTLFTQSGSEELFCAYYGSYYGAYNCNDYVAYWQAYYPGYGIPDFAPSPDGTLTEQNRVDGSFNGWAAFVDLNYAINDQWDVGVGLRYTYDEKDFAVNALPVASAIGPYFALGYVSDGFLQDKASWSETTPRFIVRYQPTDSALLFASATQGYKSGGFGTFSLNPPLFQFFGDGPDDPISQNDGFLPATFDPETVWSYEVGYKDAFLDRNLVLNLNAFYYEYEDLQVTYFDSGTKVDNVGQAKGSGIEGSVSAALGENFDLYLAASWLDSEVTGLQVLCGLDDPNGCEGSSIWWAPEFSGALVVNGSFPTAGGGEFFGSAEAVWESDRGGGWENLRDSKIDSFTEVALRAGYRPANSNWSITAYVENLTDNLTYDGSANNGDILPAFVFGPSRPRTYGIRFGYEWE